MSVCLWNCILKPIPSQFTNKTFIPRYFCVNASIELLKGTKTIEKPQFKRCHSKLCLILGYKTKNDSLNHESFQMKIIELVVTYTTNQMIHTTYHEFIPFEFSFQIDAMNASIYTKKCFIQKETHKPRWEWDKKMYEQIGRFAAVSWKWMEKDLNKRESTAKHSLFYFIHWLVSREFEV